MRQSQRTKQTEYQALIPVAKDVRDLLKHFITPYGRVFTEPRKNGLRTKFWGCRVKNNRGLRGAIIALNKKYYKQFEVSMTEYVSGTNMWSYGPSSVSIFIKYK